MMSSANRKETAASGSDHAAKHQASIDALVSRDREAMLTLALSEKTPPEMLFVLSQTPENHIRQAVAANPSTPSAVNEALSQDEDPKVRAMLVSRLGSLLPDVSSQEQSKLAERSVKLLATLAKDAEVTVRRFLAEEICALDCVPNEVAMQLAQDVDEMVALPIVEFSPVLEDDDLIELMTSRGNSAALSAIARRKNLGPDVGDRLVATGDVDAIGALLNNKSTFIREVTLDHIVSQAEGVDSWHEALCDRPEINAGLALKLATFVADSLVTQLANRDDLGPAALKSLKENISARMSKDSLRLADEDCAVDLPSEEEICIAIEGRRDAKVIWLLASRSGLKSSAVRRIMAARDPAPIVALAWKSDLSIQTATMLQRFPGGVSEAKIVRADENGDFPFSEKDMEWQLSTYGLDKDG